MNQITFFVPKQPRSLNEIIRMNFKDRGHEQDVWDLHILAQWTHQKKKMFFNPVDVSYLLLFAEKRMRDQDNYLGGTKFCLDALKRTFLTRDDSDWVKSITVNFGIGKPGTIVHIEEVENAVDVVPDWALGFGNYLKHPEKAV